MHGAPGRGEGTGEPGRRLGDESPHTGTDLPAVTAATSGRLQVIAGPMFAGKSEELMRRVRRAHLAGRAVEVATHTLDTRYAEGIASHTGDRIPAHSLPDAAALQALLAAGPPALLAVDEAQFFGPELVPVVIDAVRRGTTVVVAGLSVTFDGAPFPPLPELMARAEDVQKLTAVCTVCGRDAAYHQRLRAGGEDGLTLGAAAVGGTESYQARCLLHHRPG